MYIRRLQEISLVCGKRQIMLHGRGDKAEQIVGLSFLLGSCQERNFQLRCSVQRKKNSYEGKFKRLRKTIPLQLHRERLIKVDSDLKEQQEKILMVEGIRYTTLLRTVVPEIEDILPLPRVFD